MKNITTTAFALALAGGIVFGSAAAMADRGDRIEERLDRLGDRVDRRLDRAADRAEARGRDGLAERLDRRGDRIDRRLDRRGEQLERWHDRHQRRHRRRAH